MKNPDLPHRLFTPGPVPLPPWVKQKMSLDIIHHRSVEFKRIFGRVLRRLKTFFQTTQPVLVQNSTGTGAMESALLNTLSPGDEVLCVVSGRFGERWFQMAQNHSLNALRMDVSLGKALDLKELKRLIDSRKNSLSALLLQASETSTATLHPTKKISQLLFEIYGSDTKEEESFSLEEQKEKGKNDKEKNRKLLKRPLFIVDAMTALGATPFPMDEWNLDVVMTSSQKALMLPPGLAFISLSNRAWLANQSSRFPKFYFDLRKELEENKKGLTRFSASVSHIVALDAVLERVASKKEDLMKMIENCERKAKIVRRFLKSIHLEPFSKSPTPSVTAFQLPHIIDPKSFKNHLKAKYNVSIASGDFGLLRIGHMGFITDEDLKTSLEAIGKTFLSFSPPCLNLEILESSIKDLSEDLVCL